MRFGSSNVVFNKIMQNEMCDSNYKSCTYKGISLKVIYFLLMTVIGAFSGIVLAIKMPTLFVTLLLTSGITTFLFSILAINVPSLSKVFGTLYCLAEGMLVGIVSIVCSAVYKGVVSVAILSTLAVFGVVSLLFVSNIVKVGNKFLRFLMIYVISYLVFSIGLGIVSLFGVEFDFGFTMLVSALSIFLASLYLFFDLENIRRLVEGEYPKSLEWYASFGLAFTLIWLYVEILRLVVVVFSKVNDRR